MHPASPEPGHFIAGAGTREITPPPGFPMGGHGPAGRVARGYWTRLHARSFYFDDGRGHRLALVSAELFAIPAGLHAKVLEAVNRRQRLHPEELVLAATHTHHGPANFASAEIYNSFAGPLPNFDPVLLDFLAAQIAGAIVDSIADANTHAGLPHELRFYQGSAPGIQRNRAIAPFFANPEALRYRHPRSAAAASAQPVPTAQPRAARGISRSTPPCNSSRSSATAKPRALLLFFAVHPTAITHDADLYSGDLAGIACATLEKDRAPVAGFFNGAEGDVSPDWLAQDRDDAIHLAGRLAASAVGLLDSGRFQRDPDPEIEVRRKTVANNWRDTDGVGFASKPMSGAAEFGGAEDGRTIFYNYGWRAEARKPAPAGEHGSKEPGLDGPLAGAVETFDGNSFARAVKSSVPPAFCRTPSSLPWCPSPGHGWAAFTLAAIPVEATTAAGWAIRQETRANVIVGLANEYIGYTTSAPEYEAQQYEGASTLLGPGQAAGLARLLARPPAAAAIRRPPNTVPAQSFRAGPRRKNPVRSRIPAGAPQTQHGGRRSGASAAPPTPPPRSPHPALRLGRGPRRRLARGRPPGCRLCAVRTASGRRADTDRGLNFLTVLAEADHSRRSYTALWIPPCLILRQFLFRVRTATGKQVCSQPFNLAEIQSVAPVPPVPPSPCPGSLH